MKFKKLVGGTLLASLLALGVGVGVVNKAPAGAEPVDADDEKTVMFSASLNANDLEEAYATSNYRFHVWGTNIDETFSMHQSGEDHVYTIIVYLTDAQVVEGAQFVFYQSDGAYPGDKYSENLNLFCDGYSDISKDHNNGISFTFVSTTDWTDGHWVTTQRYAVPTPKLGHQDQIGADVTWHNFVLEPENRRYAVYDIEIAAQNKDIISFSYPGGASSVYFNPSEMFNKFAIGCTDKVSSSSNWTYLNESGTYDVFIENDFDGEGIISIKKHAAPSESFIYYVTESASPTGDYIYSWGGSEQFGAFPGTSIASLVASEKAEEVTGNGVIHFQGGETAKLVYRIEITKGYPVGDLMFMFNNGTSEYKSAEREIVLDQAYWWTGSYNIEAAQALNFLINAESYRNGADDYSVCNVSAVNATFIVGQYDAMSDEIKEIYIDCSTVYTWSDSTKTGNKLWAYKDVVAQLRKIAEAAATDSSGLANIGNHNQIQNSDTVVAIIVIVAFASISAIAMLVVIKKRKHN